MNAETETEIARMLAIWHLAEQGQPPPDAPMPDSRGNRKREGHRTVVSAARQMGVTPRQVYRVRECRRRHPQLAQMLADRAMDGVSAEISVTDGLACANRPMPVLLLALQLVDDARPKRLTLLKACRQVESDLLASYRDAGLSDADLFGIAMQVAGDYPHLA